MGSSRASDCPLGTGQVLLPGLGVISFTSWVLGKDSGLFHGPFSDEHGQHMRTPLSPDSGE